MTNKPTSAHSEQWLQGKMKRLFKSKKKKDYLENGEISRDGTEAMPTVAPIKSGISHENPSSVPSSTTPEPTQNSSSLPGSSVSRSKSNLTNVPIKELWSLAYERLKLEDPTLVEDYESKLLGSMPAALILPLGVKENNAWKLKFGGAEIQMRDLLPPILGIISHANDYITTSLNANMYPSIAWAGVSLLLPLLLRPSTQVASLSKGLENIFSLIVQGRMREELYHRRYKSRDSINSSETFHNDYKETLEALYREILRFQMTGYCYYANNGAFRLGLDIVKWNDWDALQDKVQEKNQLFIQVSEIWRDMQYDEEYATAKSRHQEIMQNWGTTNISISSLQKVIQDANAQKSRQDLLNWLSNADPTAFYNTNRDMHENGTGEWLLQESPEFKAWKDDCGSFLWIHGKAGCGKSVLSSTIIKYLETQYIQRPTIAVAYFYFSFSLATEQNVNAMLSSLVKQICCCRPDIPEAAQKLGDFKNKGGHPDTERLEDVLLSSVYGFSAVYLIIDGLDECAELGGHRKKLLKSLRSILTNAPDNLHILCTSHNEQDICTGLLPVFSSFTRIELNLLSRRNMIDNDIGKYIDSTLSSDEEFNSWPDEVKLQARKVLIEKSDGMFQYVRYQFEGLRGLNSILRINEALQNLPTGLDETYNRMFQNIQSDFRQEVISLLKWLCFSNDILTLDMLADIFILRPDCDTVLKVEDQLFSSNDVLKYLSGFVITHTVTAENSRVYPHGGDIFYLDLLYSPGEVKVRLAHFSIKEYLTSSRMLEGPMSAFSFTDIDAHLWIARSCIAYHKLLSSPYFDHASAKHDERLRRYASMLSAAMGGEINHGPRDAGRMLLRPHFYTARRGCLQLTNLLLPQDSGVNRYRTQEDLDMALQDAAFAGSESIVEKLLQEGASVNAKGMPFGTTLWAAAFGGHIAIVKILLDKGADIESEGYGAYSWRMSTPLQIAGQNGQLDTLELLISRGAKINHTPDTTKCILSLTLSQPKCFKYLLENGADVNIADCSSSALYEAARSGHWDEFDLLLDKGADIKIRGKSGYPLHGLVSLSQLANGSARSLECALERTKRLLDLGADPNASTETSGTPLYRACTRFLIRKNDYMHQIAQLLIDRGADVDIFREKYGNVFRPLYFDFDLSVMKLLLENGADISTWAQLGEYGSILHAACYAGNLPLVELLLDLGADAHSRGGAFDFVLQAACGHHEYLPDVQILKLLLDRGVNVNAQGGKYGTALQAACVCQHLDPDGIYKWVDIVRFLLDHGADVNLEGGKYGTALQAACATECENFDIVHLLLERGANIHSVGGKYGIAWHAAAQNACVSENSLQLLQLLQEHDANVNHVLSETYPYTTALHAALSQQWYTEYGNRVIWDINALQATWTSRIQLLLKLGADANLAGGIYGLPLQAACAVESRISEGYHAPSAYTSLDSLSHGTMIILASNNCQSMDINAQSGMFGTALQAAAYSGQTRSIHMLLERGAQISISGGKYKNALNAAVIRGHWDIVDILLERGKEQGCQFTENADETWLEQIRQEHGTGAVQRWEAFWKVHGNTIV
ncbi:ankyrin repeat-containing domain protein [Trichoderma velutinum]